MTTTFIAEIHNNADGAVRYVGKGAARLALWPHFFRGKQLLLNRIEQLTRWNYLKDSTLKIIRVSSLEAGLKDSVAEIFTLDEFKALPTKPLLSKPGAVYKLQYANGRWAGAGVNGKTWAHGGHVRSAITSYPRGIKSFVGGTVFEITYEDDGVIPKEINRIPAEKFYMMSPSSARHARG
jgi:hypothetical protein